MTKYEKQIGFKTIKLTFLRQWFAIACIFVPIALASLIATSLFVSKTYSATTTVSREASFSNESLYNTFTNRISATATNVATNLANNKITHANGANITVDEIVSGLSFSKFASGSLSSTITYSSSDKVTVQPVLTELVTYCESQKDSITDFKGFAVSSPVSSVNESSNQKKYLLIALAADLVVSLGVPFLFEVIGDEVYDREDVEMLGCAGFELNTQKKRNKEENEKDKYGDIQL